MSQDPNSANRDEHEVQSLFANILVGGICFALLLAILGVTELVSRAVGRFPWGFYLSFFIALCAAACLIICKLVVEPEQDHGTNWLEPETPDVLQAGYSRLKGWADNPRNRVKAFFFGLASVTILSQASSAVRALLDVNSSEPFLKILTFMAVTSGLCVAAVLLLCLLIGLLPKSTGEDL